MKPYETDRHGVVSSRDLVELMQAAEKRRIFAEQRRHERRERVARFRARLRNIFRLREVRS